MARLGRLLVVILLILTFALAPMALAPVGSASAATPAEAVTQSVSYATARSVTQFISVVDRTSGTVLARTGNANTQVGSESIMKLFIAAYYLVSYGGHQATPSAVKDRLSYMLRYSDDATASSLFTSSAIPTIAARYGMPNTTNATDRVGHWGAARITAADMTTFLYRASKDPAVGPWLIPVMTQTSPHGSGADLGFNQNFGLNALTGVHGSKQGWGCDSFFTTPTCAIHSVGYTDRTFVSVLQLSSVYPDPMRNTSTNAAQLIQRSALKPDPIGVLDSAKSTGKDQLTVRGWAADPAAPGQPEDVHVYVSGPTGRGGPWVVRTGASRGDVAGLHPWAGTATGFSKVVPTRGPGTNTVCAYAINLKPPNTNPLIGCKTVQVRDAFGYLDGVTMAPGGQLVATGWALNPNIPAEAVSVHVYVTGPNGVRGYSGFSAANNRADIGRIFPGYGSNHGYRATVAVLETGVHQVCVYAITTGGGATNPRIGCRSVNVRNAFGHSDSLTSDGATIDARGWALNPNNPAEKVQIHIYDTSSTGTRGYNGILSGTDRPDVARLFPGYGPAHGYSASIPAFEPGNHNVCIWAITTGGGTGNTSLGCRSITVSG